MKHPKLIVKQAPHTDHAATGLAAKKYREQAEVTQGAVGAYLNVTQEAVAKWEGGRIWTDIKLEKFCNAVDAVKGK